jgi:hypothetical protein
MEASIYVNEIVDYNQQYCRLIRRAFIDQFMEYPGLSAALAPTNLMTFAPTSRPPGGGRI